MELRKYTIFIYGLNIKKQLLMMVFILIIQIVYGFITTLYAIDDDVKKILAKVTGITDDDVKTASSKKEITLFDAYVLAVNKTERLAIEGEFSIQAEERKLQAIESFLPSLSLRGTKAFPGPSSNYISIARSSLSLYARLPLFTGLSQVSQIKSSWADRKVKEFQLYRNAGILLADIASTFYSVLLMEKDLKNNEQLLDRYYQQVNELKRRVQIGRSRQSDILRTNTQIYKLQAQDKSLRTGYERVKLVLATLIGINSDFKLVESMHLGELVYTPTDIAKLVENRYDVKAAKEQVEYAKAGVLAAYGRHLPSIYLDGSYILPHTQEPQYKYSQWKRALQFSLSSNPLLSLGAATYLNYGVPTKTRDYYFGLGAELPIFGGDITFAKVREANSVKRQTELSLSQTLRYAEKDIKDSLRAWESSKTEVEAYRKALVSAEENYRVVYDEYRKNLVTILDVLTSLTTLQDARTAYERSQLQLRLYRVNLGVACNEFSGDKIRILQDIKGRQ